MPIKTKEDGEPDFKPTTAGVPSLHSRTLTFAGKPGFPSGIYFGMIDILEDNMGYEVRKVKDWIEVNPQSDFYDELSQRKQSIEQQVGAVTNRISEARKELEMLRHDKRKLQRIIDHKEQGDLDVLKSDFVDLVDRNTDMSLLELANSGRFPSIVVDFYKIESVEDIEELDVSKGEKQVLKKKWSLFQDWKKRFVGEIERRMSTIDSEIRSHKETIDNLKETLHPYAKALKRIRLGEPQEYHGLDDPRIIEKYSGAISGVDLYCWKNLSSMSFFGEYDKFEPELYDKYDDYPGYEFYSFFEIRVRKSSSIVSGESVEVVTITIDPELQDRDGIAEKKEEIEKEKERLRNSIRRLSGEDVEEIEEEEGKSEGFSEKVEKLKGMLSIGDKPHKGEFEKIVVEETDELYERLKELGDGLKLWKLRKLRTMKD
ncbi:MAG: hypothetical protein ACLFQ8_03335 [Candidatus Aenigmatarchaeota archaeon]